MKENVIHIIGGITRNVDVSIKNIMYVKNREIVKHFASFMDDSAIMCVLVIESCYEETKTVPTNFNQKETKL